MINRKTFATPFLLILILAGGFLVPEISLAERIMTVQVKETQVRTTPSFLGKIVARVSYGEKVSVISTGKTWFKVKKITAPAVVGWVHGSALTTVKVTLKSGDKTAQGKASTREVALAGKGFNESIEGVYAVNHPDLDFSGVDRMEKISPAMKDVEKFMTDGDLTVGKEADYELP